MESVTDESLARWFTPAAFAASLPVIDKARAMILSTPPAGYAGCIAAIQDLDYLPHLARIHTPSLFLVGSEDPGTPPEVARAMHQSVNASRFAEIKGAAHLSNLEKPEEFNDSIVKFLRAVP